MSDINEIKRTEAWAHMMDRMAKRQRDYEEKVIVASRKHDSQKIAYAVGVHDGFALAIDALIKEGSDGGSQKDLTHRATASD